MRVRVASAGTGKTTSLVLRYLDLIASGTPLRRIAGMTFTRVGAAELRQRLGEGVATLLRAGSYLDLPLEPARRPRLEEAARELGGATITTIHGFMAEALRLCAPDMGLDPDFMVIGDWEAQAIFEEELASLAYLVRDPDYPLHAAFSRFGDEAQPLLLALFRKRSLAARYSAAPGDEANAVLTGLYEGVFERYQARLGGKMLSPADVERRALALVQSPHNLRRLHARYRLLLVDEFQDVNPLQGRFFEALEAGGLAVEAVGDPKQSIYAFRHADVEVFRRALSRGERLSPLAETRRHAGVLVRFLNHMTGTFGAQNLGFSSGEAPPVEAAGEQKNKEGRLELHWVAGDARLDLLREREAQLLAGRLKALGAGYPYNDMAVLARSYQGLTTIERALQAAGLPYVLVQGRGYFERLEVRDLYHALCVGTQAQGLSLAAWLRGPFAGLSLPEIDRLLTADNPVALLEREFGEVFLRLQTIQRAVREDAPLEVLKRLIRTPFIGGKRYIDFLDARAKENVDALLFTVATQPPGELEILLSRLELLSRQAEAGDVPQSGEGIKLLSVHRAKGLEWPVVAIFDAGRKQPQAGEALYVEPQTGLVAMKSTPRYHELKEGSSAREEGEGYRLLYVAASRARDVLIISGSVKNGRPEGWAAALDGLKVGAGAKGWNRPDFLLKTWPYGPVAGTAAGPPPQPPSPPPLWIDRRFSHAPLPPLFSPSALKGQDDEPLPLPDPEEGETVPGRARAVGTLVHYAIAQNWRANNPQHLANLEAQEVMFSFSAAEREEMMAEVKALLYNYETLLGGALPWPRDEDHAELPMALPRGSTVWQGVIDRLYRAGERWYLEDYKTDHELAPERYHFQLGVYLQAIDEVLGITPEPRLVYLRHLKVVELEAPLVKAAVEEALRSL